MTPNSDPGRDKPKDPKAQAGKQPEVKKEPPSLDGDMPDFGERVADGHFATMAGDRVVSAGDAKLYEGGIALHATLDADALKMLRVKSPDDAFRVLKGDNGGAKTSVGYNTKYAEGWKAIYGDKGGPSNN